MSGINVTSAPPHHHHHQVKKQALNNTLEECGTRAKHFSWPILRFWGITQCRRHEVQNLIWFGCVLILFGLKSVRFRINVILFGLRFVCFGLKLVRFWINSLFWTEINLFLD